MTTIIRTTATRPVAGFQAGAFVATILRAAGGMVAKWSLYAQHRRTRQALHELDDRLLQDIGLTRDDIGPAPSQPTLPSYGWW